MDYDLVNKIRNGNAVLNNRSNYYLHDGYKIIIKHNLQNVYVV